MVKPFPRFVRWVKRQRSFISRFIEGATAYPTSIFSVTQHNSGDVIQAADVNNVENEVNAVETGLINGFQHGLIFATDNTYDIGKSGTNRPRNLYLAGAPVIGGVTTFTSLVTMTALYVSGPVTATGDVLFKGGRPWWGLLPSGGDDTSAINTAITNANAATPTGGDVFLGPGTYTISGTGINMLTDVRLRGAGINATTLSYSGTGACINIAAPAAGIEAFVISDFLIAGTSSGDSGISFSANGSTPARGLVSNVKIQSFSKSSGSGGAGIRITAAIEMTFDRVDCSTNYNNWDISGNGTTTVTLRACLGRAGTNIGCYLHTGVRNVTVCENSQFSTNAAQGIYVLADSADNIYNVTLRDVWIEGNLTGNGALGMVHVTYSSTGRLHDISLNNVYITASSYPTNSYSLYVDGSDGYADNVLVDAASPAASAVTIGSGSIQPLGFDLRRIYNTGTLTVDSAGNSRGYRPRGLQLGVSAPITATTTGFPYMSSMAGTPTGAPTAITGYAPFVWDDTNKQFDVYSPGAAAWQRFGIPTMTLKKGTTSNYTTTFTTYVDVDATNLAYTVTVPVGQKVLIVVGGVTVQDSSAGAIVQVALTDGTTLLAEIQQNNSGLTNADATFPFTYIFTGDGASHTFKLRWQTSAGTATMISSSATMTPMMVFWMGLSN